MIKCSAIKLSDGQILTGHRHHNIFQQAKADGLDRLLVIRGEQGFIDENGTFYNREDAGKHAVECAQVEIGKATVRHVYDGIRLYSEDLY